MKKDHLKKPNLSNISKMGKGKKISTTDNKWEIRNGRRGQNWRLEEKGPLEEEKNTKFALNIKKLGIGA